MQCDHFLMRKDGRELEITVSIPVLAASWIGNTVITSFISAPTLVNSQLVSLTQGWILNKFTLDLQ